MIFTSFPIYFLKSIFSFFFQNTDSNLIKRAYQQLFSFHDQPNPDCPVGRNMHQVLDNRLEEIQKAMELKMKSINLEDIVKDTQPFIEKQEK